MSKNKRKLNNDSLRKAYYSLVDALGVLEDAAYEEQTQGYNTLSNKVDEIREAEKALRKFLDEHYFWD